MYAMLIPVAHKSTTFTAAMLTGDMTWSRASDLTAPRATTSDQCVGLASTVFSFPQSLSYAVGRNE